MIQVQTKKWGNSIGIIIPSEMVQELHIKPEETVDIEIKKKRNVLKELFGAGKFSKPAAQLIKEQRKEWESKWM